MDSLCLRLEWLASCVWANKWIQISVNFRLKINLIRKLTTKIEKKKNFIPKSLYYFMQQFAKSGLYVSQSSSYLLEMPWSGKTSNQNHSRHSTDIEVKWFIGRRGNCLEIMETYRIHISLPHFLFRLFEISLGSTVRHAVAAVAHYHIQTQ